MNNNLTIGRFFLAIKRGVLEFLIFTLLFFALGVGVASIYVDVEYKSSGEIQLGEGVNTIHPSNVQSILLSTAVLNTTLKALNDAEITHEDGAPITLSDLEGHFTSRIDPISVKLTYVNSDPSVTQIIMDTHLKEGKNYLDAKFPVYKVSITKEASEVEQHLENKIETILFSTMVGVLIGFVTALIREALTDRLYYKNEINDIKINIIDVFSSTKKLVFFPIQKRALKCSTDSIISFKNNLELSLLQQSQTITLLTPRNALHNAELAKELSLVVSDYYQEKTLLLGLDFSSENLIKLMGFDKESKEYQTYKEGKEQIVTINDNLDVAFYPLSNLSSKYVINDEFEAFMKEAKEKYQHIIIISSPVIKSYDHMALIKYSDINLVVIKKDETIRKDIYDTLDLLNKRTITPKALIYVDALSNRRVIGFAIKNGFKKLIKLITTKKTKKAN